MRAVIAAALALLWLVAPAWCAKRALVVGNDDYQHIDKLQKAVTDAKGYAAVLREKGFDVREGYDLGFFDLQAAVADFVARIEPGDTAVFVYSGHGWSDGARNYLVGVDAPGRASEDYLRRVSLPLRNGATGVLDDLEARDASLKIAIIDACRDNPFLPPQGGKGYGLARGLKPTSVKGSFVIYSAGEGESAMDRLSDADSDPNSVFTRIFLPLLRADLPLGDAIKTAQERVYALANSAGHEQTPAYYDEVRGKTCLTVPCAGLGSSASASASDETLASMIDNAKSADFLATLIAGLPDGPLKDRATARMGELKKTQVANLTPQPPKPAPSFPIAERRFVLPDGAAVVPQLGHAQPVSAVAFSPDGRFIVSGSWDRTVYLWDATNGALLRTFNGHNAPVYSVAFSPDGRFIVSGSGDNTLKLWDAANGALLKTFRDTFRDNRDDQMSVAFSPDGRFIVSGSGDGTLKLWDATNGALRKTFKGQGGGGVSSVAFSPDGRFIVSGSYDHTLKLWDAANGALRNTLTGHDGLVFSVAFSPDGRLIASGSGDNTLKLWDAANGALRKTFHDDGGGSSVAFSPDGRLIVSGSFDHTLKLWDAANGALLKTLDGHDGTVLSVAVSPDGRSIVSGSETTIKLWDASTGALLATDFIVDGHGVAYTPDDRFVTDGNPRAAFAIVRGSEQLPMDDFIAANRRDLLAGEIARSHAGKAP